MAKFFNSRVYNSKRTIINIVIIAVCAIGIVICFVLTRNFQGEDQNKPQGNLSIKNEVTSEINEEFTKEIFFSRIENIKLDDIDVIYPDNFNIHAVGSYDVKIVVNNEEYSSTLNIVDTERPELALKEVKINKNGSYTAKDFVSSCKDNSDEECTINFYKGVDEEGNMVDYSTYKDNGTYSIKIEALDAEGNRTIGETKLIIGDTPTTDNPTTPQEPTTPTVPEQPVNCKYGNGEYDTEHYLVAVNVTSNNCAVSLDLYKADAMIQEINKLLETETVRAQKDVEALNLKLEGTKSLNRLRTAVVNKSGDGIVGYEIRFTITIEDNMIADYKLDSNGKRVFISNPYNLPN